MGQRDQALTFPRGYRLPSRLFRFSLLNLAAVLALLCATLAPALRADTLSGTVKDPSGAVVAGARIEITGGNLIQPIVLTSDASGRFTAPDLAPGKYTVKATKDGFDPLISPVEVQGTAELQLKLIIAVQKTTVTASAKNLEFANSDPTYRQLRSIGLGDYCENVTFN